MDGCQTRTTPAANPESGDIAVRSQHPTEKNTRTLSELYAPDILLPKELRNTFGDETVITSQISDYGNDLRKDSHLRLQSLIQDDDLPDASDDTFSTMTQSFPEGYTRGKDFALGKDLSKLDIRTSKLKARRGLSSRLWSALITAWKPNLPNNAAPTQKFLPRRMLTTICSFEAVCQELRPHFELEIDAQRCTEYICGKRDEPELNNRKCSREIFAILTLIDAVELMPDFVRAGIGDDDLPFSANREVSELKTRHEVSVNCLEDNRATFEFYEKQWWVHVPYLGPQGKERKPVGLTFAAGTVMPWTFIDETTDEGGFGSVRKVQIHADHHDFLHGEFALKTLTDTPYYNKQIFEQETHVLRKIGSRPHVVELCASFIIGDEYMMLFPWAEGGNLAAVWEAVPPTLTLSPRKESAGKAEFVEWVARQCSGLVEVLHEFHGFFDNKFQDTEGRDQYGIHGDIKPANILYFTQDQQVSPLGTLKLADFGLARFHRARSRSGKPWSSAGAATQTYRSPEHDIGPVRSRKVDMWSLGCVFSEFCTWLIRGPGALKDYNDERISEEDKSRKGLWKEDNFFVKCRETTYLRVNEGTSTDIPKLKRTVSEWIESLSQECACGTSPTFLEEFLEFIRCEMLHPDRELRADCNKVKSFLTKCLRKGEADSRYWAFPHPDKARSVPKTHSLDSTERWRNTGSSNTAKRTRFEQP